LIIRNNAVPMTVVAIAIPTAVLPFPLPIERVTTHLTTVIALADTTKTEKHVNRTYPWL